jgi:hypothetical protein
MTKARWWGIGIFFVIVLTLIGGYLFYVNTGGNALSRVVWHYFIPDLPDKKYSWQDFTERGVEQGISGFYAYGDEYGFSLWTLSGLKAFTHIPGISVYMHQDICAAVRQLNDNPQVAGTPVRATKTVTGDIGTWESLIRKENLVTVLRFDAPEYHNGINKVWSYSGIYKELNKLNRESCD